MKTVLVTGGTGTLGSAIVRALCAEGNPWRIVANYRHDTLRAATLAHATGCVLWRADVGDEDDVAAMFAALAPIDAVVHAAATVHDALLLRQTLSAWQRTMATNVDGSFLVVQAAMRHLVDGGRLVLVASRVGEHGNVGQSAYAAGQAACLALMKCAAREGAARGIAVNAICPGLVPSTLTAHVAPARLEQRRAESVTNRFGTADQVAGMVRWLLSPPAEGITGQTLHCDSRI